MSDEKKMHHQQFDGYFKSPTARFWICACPYLLQKRRDGGNERLLGHACVHSDTQHVHFLTQHILRTKPWNNAMRSYAISNKNSSHCSSSSVNRDVCNERPHDLRFPRASGESSLKTQLSGEHFLARIEFSFASSPCSKRQTKTVEQVSNHSQNRTARNSSAQVDLIFR